MKKYKIKNSNLVQKIVDSMITDFSLKNDPQGSYTGRTENPFEIPVQDQDDL